MNDLMTMTTKTMSSREIAQLTGKQHKNVLRDIDTLIESLSSDLSLGFKSSTYEDASGKSNREYILDRDSTYCLVSGYDATSRMRIIKRWQELEAATRPAPVELTREQILVMALESERERIRLTAALTAAEPAIAFHDEVAVRNDVEFLIRVAAKTLLGPGKERDLVAILLSHGWLTKTGSGREATADAVRRGLMRQRVDIVNGRAYQVAVITGKGMSALRTIYRTTDMVRH